VLQDRRHVILQPSRSRIAVTLQDCRHVILQPSRSRIVVMSLSNRHAPGSPSRSRIVVMSFSSRHAPGSPSRSRIVVMSFSSRHAPGSPSRSQIAITPLACSQIFAEVSSIFCLFVFYIDTIIYLLCSYFIFFSFLFLLGDRPVRFRSLPHTLILIFLKQCRKC